RRIDQHVAGRLAHSGRQLRRRGRSVPMKLWQRKVGRVAPAVSATAQYRVRLVKFHIDTTRARHNETDHLALSARVNDQAAKSSSLFVGDVNDGDHWVTLQVGPLSLGPSDTLNVVYSILNKGDNRSAIEQGLERAGEAALAYGIYASLPAFWATLTV